MADTVQCDFCGKIQPKDSLLQGWLHLETRSRVKVVGMPRVNADFCSLHHAADWIAARLAVLTQIQQQAADTDIVWPEAAVQLARQQTRIDGAWVEATDPLQVKEQG